MDALKRDLAILRALLLAGPGITTALLLLTSASFLLGSMQHEKRVELFLVSMLFSLVCLVARATTRVRMYCESAGRLGVPHHALAMRRVQCIVIALFTLVPVTFAYCIGGDFSAVVIFVGGTAFAIYLAETLFLAVIFALSLKGLSAAGVDVWTHLFGIPGSVAILLASAWGIVRWLRLPRRLESEAAAASLSLADTAHEADGVEELDAENAAFERHLEDVLAPPSPQLLAPRRLWVGLGYDPRGNWRVRAMGLFVALAATVVLHFWKQARWDFGAYLALSAMFAFFVFSRFQAMNEAWLRTHGEQSVLVLSARWPTGTAFKFVLLRCVWSGIPELLAGWLLFSAAVLATGWISLHTVLLAGLGQVAVLVSSLGIFLSYFAHARVRNTNLLPLAYLLMALAGTATLLFSVAHGSTTGTLIGAGMLLAPAAAAMLAFFLRPALFPVQTVARK